MRSAFVLVTLLLLSVVAVPADSIESTKQLENQAPHSIDVQQTAARTSTFNVTPSSGWTTGGEEITITGSGFSGLAFKNMTYDGINHQWVTSNLDMSDQAGRWNAVAVDSNDHIHVVQIKDESYQIRHSVYDGTGWNSNGINTCGNTYCWDIHMVIDDNDHIHLAYTTYTQWDETLVYMNYDGTTWTDTVVSYSAHFGPIGIAVDSANNPHISYAVDGSNQCGDGLRIASSNGTAWSHTTVEAGNNRGCESAIVIDESDNIYIAYQDRSSSKLKIATDKSGSWDSYLVEQGGFGSNLYPGYMTSMAMDKQGQFHIAHYDDYEHDLRYSTGAPNGLWTTTLLDSSGYTGLDPSIAVDAADQPHIVYHTWSGNNLKYATINPATSNWTATTIVNNADVGEGNSIFIDDSGVMHVPFSDDTNDVLKYTTKSTGLSQTMEITVQFGPYGSVTGTVVNDTTIIVTTPNAGQTADTIDITLRDKDGTAHILASAFTFISPDDVDSDGVLNANDGCPNTAGTSSIGQLGCPDADGDGYSDATDAFPNNANEAFDTDGDGVGDNGDAFPNDPNETVDSDADGVGDNSDAFPNDPNETLDSDADGVGDNSDLYPLNANEWEDLDGDQIPDNSQASKVEITTSSEDGKIHLYHIFGNNLTLTITANTSEGFTLVSLQSTPNIVPNTGELPYGFYGGDSTTLTLQNYQFMENIPQEFFYGEYITEIGPYVNFSAHVTGTPHGCESYEEFWDTEQQETCPGKASMYRTDYYINFSMMLWNGDDDNDGVANSWDLFPMDASESRDSDGDGVGDNQDAFAFDATQWSDADGDGYGDNWGNSTWNESRSLDWPGIYLDSVVLADYCPDEFGNSTVDGYFGCLDADGDGIANIYDEVENETEPTTNETNETSLSDFDGDGIPDGTDLCPTTVENGYVDDDGCLIDEDGDGVDDSKDACPGTESDATVNANGCVVENEVSRSFLDALSSGDQGAVIQTVGIGAILLAIFGFLQTNMVAALLPDSVRWIRVLRNDSKLNDEEVRELGYLKSLVQTYYEDGEVFKDELYQLKSELTARYTNSEIKKVTLEKLNTLITDLLSMDEQELSRIAQNDAYFGLGGSIDVQERSDYLSEDALMRDVGIDANHEGATVALHSNHPLKELTGQVSETDGHEYLEHPVGSGTWYYRNRSTGEWVSWTQ